MQVLTFQLSNIDFGVMLKDVILIESNINIVRVPENSSYVKGYIYLRDQIIPVYDLALYFKYSEQEMNYLVVVNVGEIYIGFETCMINEIVEVKEKDIMPTPEAVSLAKRYFPDVICLREQIIFILDMNQLISLEEKREIDNLIRNPDGIS